MPLQIPYPKITEIPDTEPDAIPSLWNTRYSEIDANFKAIKDYIGGELIDIDGEIKAETGNFAGNVTAAYPTEDDHLATKKYVDDQIEQYGNSVYQAFKTFSDDKGI